MTIPSSRWVVSKTKTNTRGVHRDTLALGRRIAVVSRCNKNNINRSVENDQINNDSAWWSSTGVCNVVALSASLAVALGTPLLGGSDMALAQSDIEPVYFGNGCFWGRQYDFVKAEESIGRSGKDISAVVGYAGGRKASPSNKVCYYYTPEVDTIYEKLGHAEVVQVQLRGESKEDQFRRYAKTYFGEFRRLPNGKMQRQDPQDVGAGYRNVIGIPGGVSSDLFKILQDENVNHMVLREGSGNEYGSFGRAKEGDELNTVWIIDSTKFPFYQAELYHQFHNGLGKKFPAEYTKDLKETAVENNLVKETGCPEYFFLGS